MLAENRIEAIDYRVEGVGKHLKASKTRYLWVLCANKRLYNVAIDSSLVSGKIQLAINGKVFLKAEQDRLNPAPFQHCFVMEGHEFKILQTEDSFQLRVDNETFLHRLNQEKTNREFVCKEDNAIVVDQNIRVSSKKIVLSIPAIGGNCMKKKKTLKSQAWNELVGKKDFDPFSIPEQVKPEIVHSEKLASTPTKENAVELQNASELLNPTSSADLCAVTTPVYQAKDIPIINLQQFNTLQNLFATNTSAHPLLDKIEGQVGKPHNPTQEEVKISTESTQLNTVKNMLATLKITDPILIEKQLPLSEGRVVQSLDMFAEVQSTATENVLKPTTSLNESDLQLLNINDFNKMQHLFKTMKFNPLELTPVTLGAKQNSQ